MYTAVITERNTFRFLVFSVMNSMLFHFMSHKPVQYRYFHHLLSITLSLFHITLKTQLFYRSYTSPDYLPHPQTFCSSFLANVNSRSRSLYVVVRPSVVCLSVCNVPAPYSGDWNFRQCFYSIWHAGHLLTSRQNFTEIVPGEPHRRGS